MTELPDDELLESQAAICGILCNTNRLKLVHLLSQDEYSVSELAEETGLAQATVSQHLRKMRDRKTVSRRIEGNRSYYRIRDERLVEALQTIQDILLDRHDRQ
jgi:DNA-binding transcriptional ArsR family regulator